MYPTSPTSMSVTSVEQFNAYSHSNGWRCTHSQCHRKLSLRFLCHTCVQSHTCVQMVYCRLSANVNTIQAPTLHSFDGQH